MSAHADRVRELVDIVAAAGGTPNVDINLHEVGTEAAKAIVEATLPEGVTWTAHAGGAHEWLTGRGESGVKIIVFLSTKRAYEPPKLAAQILKAAGA